HRSNGNTELRLTQVDVGPPGAVRRLLQGLVPPMGIRRLQSKLPKRTILWEFVNLIGPDPLRRVKLRMSSDKLAQLHPADLADIMEEMNPDAAADLIQSLEPERSRKVLDKMEDREARDVKELMRFAENTAGGMMTTEIVVVGEDATRGEVVDYIRFHEITLDQLDNIVLINREARLAGTVPVARLVLADADQR